MVKRPSGGYLYDSQVAFATTEIQAASIDRPLIVAVHHPPLSIDTHHGGSQRMHDALAGVFSAAGRVPDIVLTGHVHDGQFFTWQVAGGQTRAIVNGCGGYHNRHPIASDYVAGMRVTPDVVCDFADADHYGFIEFSVAGGKLSGDYIGVMPGADPMGTDATSSVLYSFTT